MLLAGLSPGEAFDVFPEFHSLSENEVTELDRTDLIDSEYQSDVITFLPPLRWDADLLTSKRALDLTTGSLSGNFFMQWTRARLKHSLFENLEFRFTYFQQRDWDTDQTHAILELVQRISPALALSAYGEPSATKRQTDFGLALLINPSTGHEIRLFHTWVDVTRASHNDQPDRFSKGKSPVAWGLVGRCEDCLGRSFERGRTDHSSEGSITLAETDADWLEYHVRIESPTEWSLPQSDLLHTFEHWSTGVKARWFYGQGWAFNTRLQASRKKEARSPLGGTSSVTHESYDRRIYESLVSVESPNLLWGSIPYKVEPGLGWFERTWQTETVAKLRHNNFTSFVWMKWRGPVIEDHPSSIDLGYEVTIFQSDMPEPLRAWGLKRRTTEHRLNFRYMIPFRDSAQLSLALTGDPDAATRGEGGLFEGGNAQFRAFF